MYGLVNRAVRDLVITQFGEAKWASVSQRAELDDDNFVCMSQYPDHITYDLVSAASKELNLSSAEVLRAFGQYWIKYTAKEGYGELIARSGRSFVECLENLNDLHGRVALTFPDLKPPSFQCERTGPNEVALHYISHREGLTLFVVGLLEGLAELYGTEINVRVEVKGSADHENDVFHISYTD